MESVLDKVEICRENIVVGVGSKALRVGRLSRVRSSNAIFMPSAGSSIAGTDVESVKLQVVVLDDDFKASLVVVTVTATSFKVVSFNSISNNGSINESSVGVNTIQLISNRAKVHHSSEFVVRSPCSLPVISSIGCKHQ